MFACSREIHHRRVAFFQCHRFLFILRGVSFVGHVTLFNDEYGENHACGCGSKGGLVALRTYQFPLAAFDSFLRESAYSVVPRSFSAQSKGEHQC